jgi:hypothetical protein
MQAGRFKEEILGINQFNPTGDGEADAGAALLELRVQRGQILGAGCL